MAPFEPAAFDRGTLDAFFAAVLANDEMDQALMAPAAVPLFHTADRLAGYHRLCRQTWADGLDRAPLIDVARAAMGGRCPDGETLTAFKHARAKFKQLRYASVLCERDHRVPLLLDRATVLMGQLQDACRCAQRGRVRLRGAQLRLMLSRPLLARMAEQAAALRMIDPKSFAGLLDRDLDGLALLLEQGMATGPAFHAARKVVSRHNSFWTAMSVLHPGSAHHRLFRWMSAINGAMGAVHDGLVARRARQPGSYRDSFPLPDEVTVLLTRLVALPRTCRIAG